MYPIETVEQIKTAAAYFDKYIDKFHPSERITIAGSMEKQASALNVSINSDWMHNYSRKSPSYSPEFDLHMKMRKEASMGKKIGFNGKVINAAELLDKISSLKGHIKPDEMINLIDDFDKKAGLVSNYDKNIRDPFFTVHGSSINPRFDHQKIASNMYADQLEIAAHKDNFISKLASSYGKDFADGFKQDPINVYESMPTPDKQNIVDMAREANGEA
jgi:hypothetical protein